MSWSSELATLGMFLHTTDSHSTCASSAVWALPNWSSSSQAPTTSCGPPGVPSKVFLVVWFFKASWMSPPLIRAKFWSKDARRREVS